MKATLMTADSSTGGKYWCCVWDENTGCAYHGSIKNAPQKTPFDMKSPSTAAQKIKGKLKKDYMVVASFECPDLSVADDTHISQFLENAERALSETAFVGLIAQMMNQSSELRGILNDISNVETAKKHPGRVQLNEEQENIIRQEYYQDVFGAW